MASVYYLFWDESDENEEGTEKIRRAAYSSLDEAVAQATHDLLCLRCRVTDERGRATLESTGKDPLDPTGKTKCQDCGGSGKLSSRTILRIEKWSDREAKGYHRLSREAARSDQPAPAFTGGEVVWTPE